MKTLSSSQMKELRADIEKLMYIKYKVKAVIASHPTHLRVYDYAEDEVTL